MKIKVVSTGEGILQSGSNTTPPPNMTRRRSTIASIIFATASCSCNRDGGASRASGFLAAPQPEASTLRGRQKSGGQTTTTSTAAGAPRNRTTRIAAVSFSAIDSVAQHSSIAWRRRVNDAVVLYGDSALSAAGIVGRGRGVFDMGNGLTVLRATGGTSMPKAAARSKEEMDAEWERILEEDNDDDDDDDGDDDDQDKDEDKRSDEELLLGFDVKGGEFDDVEGGMDSILGKGDSSGGEGQRLEARMPYKQRMKLQKERQEAWAEKRKTFSPAHNAHIDMVAQNRAIAAARREKYTKKFFRKKKIYDIIKEKDRKEEREAVWATRWPRKVTRSAADLKVGEWVEGKVRNVESYGAWVDIGLERDCLLHVREMSRTFTPRARDAVSTKDVVRVRVTFVNADECKVGLSLIEEGPREGDLPPAPPRPSISILDVSPGQQLWGHVERATNFGAYVDVGTEVPGFLHLKEIPGRPKGVDAPEVLPRNRRLRVYAKEIDLEAKRIKLTCKRPKSKPRCGPKSALASDAYLEEFDYDDSRLPGARQDEIEWDDDEEEDWGEDGWGNDVAASEDREHAEEREERESEEWSYQEQSQPVAEVGQIDWN